MKLLYILIISFYMQVSKASDFDFTTEIKISAPAWYVNKLGNSMTQVWLINKQKEVQYINYKGADNHLIQALSITPNELKNTPKVTYEQLIKVQPHLEKPIQLAFQKGANYVVLDISPDKSLLRQDVFNEQEKSSHFCPPCKKQTDELMAINNKDIIVLKLRMAM